MERNYLQEMRNLNSSILQEIREILTKSENETHTFKYPFYVHWGDEDCSGTNVCYSVTKGNVGDSVIFGFGSYDSTEEEEEIAVTKFTYYSTESLVEVLNRLRDETRVMTARITFRSEVYITGKSLKEIKEKFEGMPIFSADALEKASADFIEVVSVTDDENSKDLFSEFQNA